MRTTVVLLCLALLCACAPAVFAQATDGNLVGTVTDPTQAAVPGASLQLQNTATGVKYAASTDSAGNYRFGNVPIGTYMLTASASGFSQAIVREIVVGLNATKTVNVVLQVGQVATSVEVTSQAEQIDTTTAQVQSSFESRQISNLPIIENSVNSYGALNLALLGAGVASNGGVGQGTGPAVGGQRPMNNNFTIEGVDNNNKGVTGPLVYIPIESTAEFTLMQNQFSAEFGHSSGGQFNTVVKSGTNEIHGSLYEYFQNRNLNAIDESFARQGYRERSRYDQNRLGASVGGPIKKNKLFYYGNYEYAPLGLASAPGSPVQAPTAEGFSQLATLPGISKTNFDIFKQYVSPAPAASDSISVAGKQIPIGMLPISAPNFTNQYVGVASVDYNATDKDQIRGRYIYNKISALDTYATLPVFWMNQPNTFHLLSTSYFHSFTPNVTNEMRLGYNRFNQDYPIPDFKYPGLDAFPNIDLYYDLNLSIGPDSNAPQSTVQNTYQFVDNVNWTRGKHSLKFGFDGRKYISPQIFVQRMRGEYSYTGLEDFLMDRFPTDLAERNVGDTKYYGDQVATYFYGTDTWRLKPNFSINLGLRYEYSSVPYTMRAQSLNSISDVPGVLTFPAPAAPKKNFAPRIGFAYSPGKSGATSIRGGFGMAYDVVFDNVGLTAYPPQLSATVDQYEGADGFLARGGIPNVMPGLSQEEARAYTSSYLPATLSAPYSLQWNFGVQHVFKQNWTVEARYLGTKGVHLIVQDRFNMPSQVTASHSLPTYLSAPSQAALDSLKLTLDDFSLPTSNLAQYGFTSPITGFLPIGNSMYHGLALQVNRRFSHGFQMVGAYTWSHNLDDSTATHMSTSLSPRRPQDFLNMRNDWASSALDRRHRMTMNWVWETPWFAKDSNWFKKNILGNFLFTGTYTAESPEYATPQSGTDANINGDTASDRGIVNPAGDPNRGSGVTALKNSAGQTVAYLANDPTARYIVAGRGALANGGRNTFPTMGINNFDFSLGKRFNLTETKRFEFRADFSNALNHPQYTPGSINSVRLTSYSSGARNYVLIGDKDFGNWSGNFASNARSIQLVAKITF